MTGAWAALVLLAATPQIDARIAASAAAAEALHGPLDGGWVLNDARGQTLYLFQIADPVPGEGALEAAWRDPAGVGGDAAPGAVASILLTGGRLILRFAAAGEPVSVILAADGRDAWTGHVERRGRRTAVTLRRP